MCILLGKEKKKKNGLPTLFFSSPLRQYNNNKNLALVYFEMLNHKRSYG